MSREAMQLALAALESDPISHAGLVSRKQAITALRQALETEQKTSPSKREWVGLTLKEILINRHLIDWTSEWSYVEFAREIERALKEKNHG